MLFKKLQKENNGQSKFGKYVIYALGETVLIVIGILVAVQLNNWNEYNKERVKESVTLEELKSDLGNNIEQIDSLLNGEFNELKRLEALELLIVHLDDKLLYHDSLNTLFWYVLNLSSVTFKQSGYESLRSIGIDLIDDDELRSMIGNYYSVDVPIAVSCFKEVRDDFYHYMLNYIRKDFVDAHLFVDNKWIPGTKPNNYAALVSNNVFLQSLKVYWPLLNNFVGSHEEVLNNGKMLRTAIDARLEEIGK